LATVRCAYVDGHLGQIHLRLAGLGSGSQKRPLLCFHMSPYSGVIYERFVSELGNERLTVAPDTPGFGNSDVSIHPPEIEDYAQAMADVIDALELRSVDVMGYHTGSETAVELARQRPGHVHRLVMVSAPIWSEQERKTRPQIFSVTKVSEDGSHLQAWWQSAMYWSMKGRNLDDIGRVFPVRCLNPDISYWGHRAAHNYDLAAALKEVYQPILVLNPDDDLVDFTPRAAPLLQNPDSYILDLPGWSHGFLDLKCQETAKIVRDFVDDG